MSAHAIKSIRQPDFVPQIVFAPKTKTVAGYDRAGYDRAGYNCDGGILKPFEI